jgi:hypothetical protein
VIKIIPSFSYKYKKGGDFFMVGQRGFLYEKTIYDMLLKNNLTTVKYRPSSSGHGADSAFKIKNKFYKLEVKLELAADFGQGTLRYDIDNQTWTYLCRK